MTNQLLTEQTYITISMLSKRFLIYALICWNYNFSHHVLNNSNGQQGYSFNHK